MPMRVTEENAMGIGDILARRIGVRTGQGVQFLVGLDFKITGVKIKRMGPIKVASEFRLVDDIVAVQTESNLRIYGIGDVGGVGCSREIIPKSQTVNVLPQAI